MSQGMGSVDRDVDGGCRRPKRKLLIVVNKSFSESFSHYIFLITSPAPLQFVWNDLDNIHIGELPCTSSFSSDISLCSTMTHSLMTLDISGNKMQHLPLDALQRLHSLSRLVAQR